MSHRLMPRVVGWCLAALVIAPIATITRSSALWAGDASPLVYTAEVDSIIHPVSAEFMVSAIDRLRAAHPGAVVVAVSHADPIKAAVAHAMGTHLDLFQRIVISTCSITAIAYGDSGPVVLTVNSTGSSLGELRPS